jgi:hypothetical protein
MSPVPPGPGLAAALGRLTATLLLLAAAPATANAIRPLPESADFRLTSAAVEHHRDLGVLRFTLRVEGAVGATLPAPHGAVDGAPVLGYVFPTTLAPNAVGFGAEEGTLALAITSHPDFDDTPLWDESGDGDPTNDGLTLHTHWVVLVEDTRVPGCLAVAETRSAAEPVRLPPTHPGMPLLLDSPGFPARARGHELHVVVPIERVAGRDDFRYDAVTAFLSVNQSDPERPMLGVYRVYSVLSGDLSLPYRVEPR